MKTFQKLGRMPIMLTGPALAVLLVVFGIPIILLFLTSLKAPAFSLTNYQSFFSQPANVRVLYQTLEISGLATAICLLVGYPTAYLIVAASKRLRMALILVVVIPYLTSLLARTYAWIVILGDNGLINNLLLELGLISSPLQLIYNRLALYIGMVHIMLPMMILALVSVMMGIDKSLMAAARSMGARPFTAFWRVFFPLSMPGVRSGCLLVFVICLGFYITPAALGGLGDAMLSTFIASQVQTFFDMGRVAASAFILLAVAIVVLSTFGLDLSGTQRRAAQPARKSWANRLPVFGGFKRHLADEIFTPRRAKRWTTQLYQAGSQSSWSKVVGIIFLVLIVFYLLVPELLVVIMSFSAGQFLEFPPPGLSLQWYRAFFGDPSWYGAAWTSLQIGIVTTILSTILGTLAAYGLNRSLPRLRSTLTMVILTPITFPVIVVAIATYLGLLKLGLLGSMTGIVLAHTIGAIGYVVVIVSATLANFDSALERAAMSMGANPLRTFIRVTLPLIRPGIIGGAVFAFLASFDEVVVTSLVAGFSIRTLPLKMWENIRNQIDPTIAAVSSLLILIPVVCLIVLYVAGWRSTPSLQRAGTAAAA
ncbi:ABC transporter permease subunit [Mesorhizobium sp. M4B.F.Ca.ET.190.01.1.1]|uniref:ABC transporter permease subunit n=1 Tax=unclassified Mesorhizobium TaxID=325217 RepID=UPI0004946BBB|nr:MULTISPECIES: ABC transporter permease subunit [Mesorhizobium]RUW85663.1 ABC transporter permease subunit [Mesorhizobium sp. M1E.F.Ca.ET.063.01.1.1]RWF38629.1 MAG: ABC transporter permease subunit [Mesorhizobium sp.]RWO96759.1 MAG: ABC transporter permease subunit [Mesorhizobium sp.]TGQ99259.1 ABC transporter permease subunit [Mesorhizobium sp. M4B.F.Ca.ET.200.01.1.1]TGS11427.1 ABC transporter permease subunit [Mesorhizobium sp. M4B.F.Ca.ET.190.01.1.1]